MKKRIATVIVAVFLTFVITQNAALTTVTVKPLTCGYEVGIFGTSKVVE